MSIEEPMKVKDIFTEKGIEKVKFFTAIDELINNRLFNSKKEKDSVIISIEELRNAAAIESFTDDEIKELVIEHFNNEKSVITVSEYIIDGKEVKKGLQFIKKNVF